MMRNLRNPLRGPHRSKNSLKRRTSSNRRLAGGALWLVMLVLFSPVSACGSEYACKGRGATCQSYIYDPDICVRVPGCRADEVCFGVRCDELMTEQECLAPGSCEWRTGGCTYLLPEDPCIGLAEDRCQSLSMCIWGKGCAGTPRPCGDTDSQSQCDEFPHCRWDKVPSNFQVY